jgi:hypothetical protein
LDVSESLYWKQKKKNKREICLFEKALNTESLKSSEYRKLEKALNTESSKSSEYRKLKKL